MEHRELMNLVMIGHVDHGKSTVIGRLLADSESLPKGKLENLKAMCEKNSKVFEYAFLLDALKEEQSQGITIDSARCFMKTKKRDYIIIDAPGHIEFLKNMITGAARAESALIVIDAKEGIQENTKRHGYLVSMLGIGQVSVLINKMDLVGFDENVFENIKKTYSEFLLKVGVEPVSCIPISARDGENIMKSSSKMPWYKGPAVFEQIDCFNVRKNKEENPFRFSIQDIYKFTQSQDDRRILAGNAASGKINTGDEVIFFPSGRKSKIRSIEIFGSEAVKSVSAGETAGFTLEHALYSRNGEIMCRTDENNYPEIAQKIKVNLFWMENAPLIKNKIYKMKIGTSQVMVKLSKIINTIDASELTSVQNKEQIDRYDVAECILESRKPFAFDLARNFEETGRFVIIDQFAISGCGIVLEAVKDGDNPLNKYIEKRKTSWDFGFISRGERQNRFRHPSKFVLIAGDENDKKETIAKKLERRLFDSDFHVYYVGISSIMGGLDNDLQNSLEDREEQIRRLGELSKILSDSGLIFISTINSIDEYDIQALKILNEPNDILIIQIGKDPYSSSSADLKFTPDLTDETILDEIIKFLYKKEILLEYYL
ncbi:MAG TPA: adenylyl-sulfate kinase [Spirochaetia bacterium]|nr:MAG: adenylyl-sulfate kinase [Spirochaetes bacterium GWB1_36_13]HCL57142.1 adenylyl-sulfate kinase [Spirochaetia bacterium]